jgi:hypothetical protein
MPNCRYCRRPLTDEGGVWEDDGPMLRHVCAAAPGSGTRHEPAREYAPLEYALVIAISALLVMGALIYGGVVK